MAGTAENPLPRPFRSAMLKGNAQGGRGAVALVAAIGFQVIVEENSRPQNGLDVAPKTTLSWLSVRRILVYA